MNQYRRSMISLFVIMIGLFSISILSIDAGLIVAIFTLPAFIYLFFRITEDSLRRNALKDYYKNSSLHKIKINPMTVRTRTSLISIPDGLFEES